MGATLPVIATGAASAHALAPARATSVQTAAPAPVVAQAQETAPVALQAAAPATYTVASGDCLSRIAVGHHVQGGWQKLYELNRSTLTKGPDLIFPGQKLVLSAAAPATATPASAKPAAPAAPAAKPAVPTSRPAAQISYSAGSIQALAASVVPADQFASFSQIISHESGWNVHATNPSSGAYGLAQALPGSKMASTGSDWRDNPVTQIKWALDYMNSRYGSPNAAWAFWQTHHWY
ncbi:LysM peptidoglycan-binding domain-containing protein [Kitasatospora atroaurantiaca]|uniref:LysM peptidoglycan-binding domain-containing protein n=1 Tax=Kitasatospora atroaurantiaca TaxID=285545 RepID=UPI0024832698|nr:LysM peptidoglycan-binding domain-containing protein [Kitasatospora atroaurantiaca]